MISNHIPTLAMLATSCRDSSIRCWADMPSHSPVPYRLSRSGGAKYIPANSGASQSTSTVGS